MGNDSVFLLKGYAGTGKTTLMGGICRYITSVQKREVRLMAPTGRAARILGDKNKRSATTIHRGIYNFHKLETEEGRDEQGQILDGFQFVYTLASDADIIRQVFVIDEASMVSDAYAESEFFRFGSGYLLRDLLTFAKVGLANVHTQLIFVGDPAQLPPFGMNDSPALNEMYFQEAYKIRVQSAELRQVVRQGVESGVLAMATQIRQGLASGYLNYFEVVDNSDDVRNLPFGQFWDAYAQADRNKIIITYKNKTAKSLNDQVRAKQFGPNAPALMPGDIIIVAQNNYRHDVTNGTFGMVQSVGKIEPRTVFVRGQDPVELRWQYVEVLFRGDDTELRTEQALTLLNFLESDEGKLTSVEMRGLFIDFCNRMSEKKIKRKTPEFSEYLKVDPYFASLMIKHAYAITCHKAQGGEWRSVFTFWDKNTSEDFNSFIDEQLPTGRTNTDFFRWAYTAITRSSDVMLAVNPPRFTPFSEMSWIDVTLANEFLVSQGAQSNKLAWGSEQQALINRLGLTSRELFIQHKIAGLSHQVATISLTIDSVRSTQYLETIKFRNPTESVGVSFWYNGQRKFTRYQKAEGSDTLFALIEPLLNQSLAVTFELPFVAPMESVQKPSLVSPRTDKPFIDLLRQKMTEHCTEKSIRLSATESFDYRERYTFERGSERSVADFVYDGDGFFTEVRPLPKLTNSNNLLVDMRQIIQLLRT